MYLFSVLWICHYALVQNKMNYLNIQCYIFSSGNILFLFKFWMPSLVHFFSFLLFIYSHVHSLFGSFLLPAPTPILSSPSFSFQG
jgi:hypothetical protein